MKIICKSYHSSGKRCKREAEGNFSFCAVHRWERWDAYGRYTEIPHIKKKNGTIVALSTGKSAITDKNGSRLCGHPVEVDGLWSKCTRMTKGDKCWQHGGRAEQESQGKKGQTNLFDEL